MLSLNFAPKRLSFVYNTCLLTHMLFGDLLFGDTLVTSYLACLIHNCDGLVDRDQTLRVVKKPSL